jgi:hypothetical protein
MSDHKSLSLKSGDLVLYPYIWGWQADQGHEIGEKLRPAFVMHISADNKAIICGITTRFVKSPRLYVPVPEIECVRAGLHDREFSKIVISECNVDDVRNMSTRPVKMGATFSPEFLKPLRQRFMTVLAKKRCLAVHREVRLPERDDDQPEMSMG